MDRCDPQLSFFLSYRPSFLRLGIRTPPPIPSTSGLLGEDRLPRCLTAVTYRASPFTVKVAQPKLLTKNRVYGVVKPTVERQHWKRRCPFNRRCWFPRSSGPPNLVGSSQRRDNNSRPRKEKGRTSYPRLQIATFGREDHVNSGINNTTRRCVRSWATGSNISDLIVTKLGLLHGFTGFSRNSSGITGLVIFISVCRAEPRQGSTGREP